MSRINGSVGDSEFDPDAFESPFFCQIDDGNCVQISRSCGEAQAGDKPNGSYSLR